MNLHKESRIVAWAFLFSPYPPCVTTLCQLFWRCVALTPFQCVAAIVFSPIWYPIFLMDTYGWPRLRERQYRRAIERRQRERRSSSRPKEPSAILVLWLGLKSVKSKVCPIVWIDHSTTAKKTGAE